MTATKPLPAHGTPPTGLYDKRRRVLLATGRWNPWTDAQPVRDHIAALGEVGIGWMRAAGLAGLSTGTVSHWLYGHGGYPPPRQIGTDLAAKMLAVRPDPDNLADGALVDSLVTVRQVQALAADGFPMTYLAGRLGRDATNLSRIMRRLHVESAAARSVAALFSELAGTDPAAVGISPRGIAYIRNWAAKKGWPTSQQWDGEIDNPDADPGQWMRAAKAFPDEIVADAEWLVGRHGHTWETAAARLGVHRNTLHQWRTRARRAAEAEAAA